MYAMLFNLTEIHALLFPSSSHNLPWIIVYIYTQPLFHYESIDYIYILSSLSELSQVCVMRYFHKTSSGRSCTVSTIRCLCGARRHPGEHKLHNKDRNKLANHGAYEYSTPPQSRRYHIRITHEAIFVTIYDCNLVQDNT